MKSYVKKEWSLVALEECIQREIMGGYFVPNISNTTFSSGEDSPSILSQEYFKSFFVCY